MGLYITPSRRVILTASEADLLEEVDDGVLLELLPPRPRVGVDVVAQAAAVEVICGGGERERGSRSLFMVRAALWRDCICSGSRAGGCRLGALYRLLKIKTAREVL